MEKSNFSIKSILNNNNNNNNENNNNQERIIRNIKNEQKHFEIPLKVIVNKDTSVPLLVKNVNNIKNFNYNDIKNQRPFCYHNTSYDTKNDLLISESLDGSYGKIVCKNSLYDYNIKYTTEENWEMCFLNRDKVGDSIIIWSWEFGELEISKLITNIEYFTFGLNTNLQWYIGNKIDDKIFKKTNSMKLIENYIIDNFLNLPIKQEINNRFFVFDTKLDLSEYINGSNQFYLAATIKGGDIYSGQLFRSRSLNYRDVYPYNTNQNYYQYQYQYPFSIYFELVPPSNTTNNQEGNDHLDDNDDSEYYFIVQNETMDFKNKVEYSKIKKWSVERVQNWLFDLSFFHLMDLFRENQIDGKKLSNSREIINLLPNTLKPKIKQKFIKKLDSLLFVTNNNQKDEVNIYQNSTTSNLLVLKKMKSSSSSSSSSPLSNNNNNKQPPFKSEQDELKKYQYDQLQKELMENKFRINDENSDYQLIVQDKAINCHKHVLSNMSDYFNTLFQSNSSFQENQINQSTFQIDNYLNFESMKNLIQLVYLSKQSRLDFLKQLNFDQLNSILNLSNRFLIPKIENFIENFIIWSINSSNINLINQIFIENQKISLFSNFALKYFK